MSRNSRKNRELSDTPLYKLTLVIFRWFMLSLLWLLFSVPLVTAGAASYAALRECKLHPSERDGIFRRFYQSFLGGFVRSTLFFLVEAVLCALLALDLTFYRQFFSLSSLGGWIVSGLAIVLFFVILSLSRFILFEYDHEHPLNWKPLIRRSFISFLKCLPAAGMLFLLDIGAVATVVSAPVLIVLLLLFPGFHAFLFAFAIQWFSRRYETK